EDKMKKFFRIFRISAVIMAFAGAFLVLHKPAVPQTDDCSLDKEAAKKIFKTAGTFDKTGDECVFNVSDASGKMLGRVLYAKPDETSVAGFGGNLRVVVGISPDGKIAGIELGENYESVGFIERVRETGFFEKWNGLSVEEAAKADVDTVSGATMSTRAIKSMVALNLSKYSGMKIAADQQDATPLWLKIAVFVILAYSLFAFFFPQKTAKFRIFHLAALAVVLGFISGSALSFESFKNWLTSGNITLVPVVILALALVIPVIFGRNFYCSFICPFGAMQELLGKIPLPKKNFSPKFMKGVPVFKGVLLVLIYAVMISGMISDLTVFEPFSAFKFEAASLPSLVIAAVFLIVSLFISRPWCRFFCPTGTLINMFAKRNGEEI
ncbi:4Fe-4S binding protein, partial [bacterium]|nr:4Fe-4S binding protein [bacterium]